MIAGLVLLLQLSSAPAPPPPRWAVLHDIRLGGPIDDILAKGGECQPGDAAGPMGGTGVNVVIFAQMSFGYALPHYHQPRDSAAIRRALGLGTICWAPLDSTSHAMVTAVNRKVVAMVVYATFAAFPRRLIFPA